MPWESIVRKVLPWKGRSTQSHLKFNVVGKLQMPIPGLSADEIDEKLGQFGLALKNSGEYVEVSE